MNFPMVFRSDDRYSGPRYIILLGPLNDNDNGLEDRPTSPGISISAWQGDEVIEYKDDFYADLDRFGWKKVL